ncbi:MAG TPA: hypothetical protein VG253_16350 [Streptosporangiaceae bacterium]|jgi:hypothetical protein|nr:hypothetical protein [Streptosporangiaceae bacterium]
MGLFDNTAKRLATGPTLLLQTDPAEAMADALLAYDPGVRTPRGRFVFGNGVVLCGPVEINADLAMKAALPAGMTAGYYAEIIKSGAGGEAHGRRPDPAKWQDAERLVRGLAARLGGIVHDERPRMEIHLGCSVYAAEPVPAEEVIGTLQPYTDDTLFVDKQEDVAGAYLLVSEQEPRFITSYYPPLLSRSKVQPPPLALGPMRKQEPCRWELSTWYPVETASREIRLTVGTAALALARRTDGAVVDAFGFPVGRPEDLLPR